MTPARESAVPAPWPSEWPLTNRCPVCGYIGWSNYHDTLGPLCPRGCTIREPGKGRGRSRAALMERVEILDARVIADG